MVDVNVVGVVLGLDAEPLGEPATPCPLLADGGVAGRRRDLVELLERFETVGVDEPAADDDVLVGERHQRPVVRLAHQTPQHLVALGVTATLIMPISTHGVPPMRSSVENVKPCSLPLDPGRGDQDPVLLGLGDCPAFERPLHRRQFIEIGIGERSRVVGRHVESHVPHSAT